MTAGRKRVQVVHYTIFPVFNYSKEFFMTFAGWCFMLTACITITIVFVWCILRILLTKDESSNSNQSPNEPIDDEHVKY